MAGKTITKRELADTIAAKLDLQHGLALQAVQAVLDGITDELAAGNRLEFRDFGVFETIERRPRMALNPKTLEKVPVKRKVVVKFKVGRLMKQRVDMLSQGSGDGTNPA